MKSYINPLSTNPTHLPTNCLSVFDHFVKLALKGLKWEQLYYSNKLAIEACSTHWLLPGVSFLYPLKTSVNLKFSDVFRQYKKGTTGSCVNPFRTNFPINPLLHFMWKPVNWFGTQIRWLVSIWNVTLD